MLKNYIITIFRQIRKNKVFSFINIFGLALGMAACLVIAQYVNFHTSFDKFHSKSDRIYRLESDVYRQGELLGPKIETSSMLVQTLKEVSPEVEQVTRFYDYNYANTSIIYNTDDYQVSFEQGQVYGTEPELFDIFDFDFVAGSAQKFNEPKKAILTLSASKKYFDDPEKAIGSQFTLSGNDGSGDYELVGVLKDLPENSHIDFELLLSFESLDNFTEARKSWTRGAMISYLLLSNTSKTESVLADVNQLFDENAREEYSKSGYDLTFSLQPLDQIHLNPKSTSDFTAGLDNSILIALSIISIIILVIAWINYMNLSLVRTIERLKEMGIRKCMGSSMKQITQLFILESFVMNVIAFILAMVITQVFEKFLLEVTGLPLSALLNMDVLVLLAALIVAGTIIIGLYPYALLKAINIVNVLVGQRGKVGGVKMRKGLVFAQFIITFLLISGTLTVYNQINFMRDADLGIEIENILVLESPPVKVHSDQREDVSRLNTFKTELLKHPGISQVTNAGEIPGKPVGWGASIYLKNQSRENSVSAGLISMDLNFTSFFGIDLVAGRELRKGDDPWTKGDIVINRKMAELLGFSNPEDAIGAQLDGFYGPTLEVRGVVENHHHTSLHNDYPPLLYVLSNWTEYYFVKLKLDENSAVSYSDQLTGLIQTVESEWSNVFTDYQMDYFFLDQSFDAQYKEDIRFGKIFTGFSSLAIIIACMGLFGLTSFTIQQRTKEIGIRKVLGASIQNLTVLLSKEYLTLVFIACIVSIPVAWWMMNQFLNDYTFRISLGWWFYVIPVLFVLVLALLSVLTKIMATVKTNPVESLKYE